MSSLGIPPTSGHATEIVACVRSCLRSKGLERTQEYFDGMEHLLSGLPWWNWVKTEVEELFAKERERLERLELARAKAAASVVYQLLPTAQTGIGVAEHIDQMAVGDGTTMNHHQTNKIEGEKRQ